MITHKQSKTQVQQIAEFLREANVPLEDVQQLAYDIFGIFKPIHKENINIRS